MVDFSYPRKVERECASSLAFLIRALIPLMRVLPSSSNYQKPYFQVSSHQGLDFNENFAGTQHSALNTFHKLKKKMVKEYCEQLYANKLDNLEKLQSVERHKLPKLSQEAECLNRPIISKEIELVV